jgi:hypothetical protein
MTNFQKRITTTTVKEVNNNTIDLSTAIVRLRTLLNLNFIQAMKLYNTVSETI